MILGYYIYILKGAFVLYKLFALFLDFVLTQFYAKTIIIYYCRGLFLFIRYGDNKRFYPSPINTNFIMHGGRLLVKAIVSRSVGYIFI